jgi:hypothetical protein
VRGVRALVGLAVLSAGVARADLFGRLDQPVLRPLGRALAVSVAKSIPIPAASAGISFTFDPRTSAFVRDVDVAGQVHLEQARPIGAGKLNAAFTYQWISTDTLDGEDLDALRDPRPIVDPAFGVPVRIPHLAVDLDTHVMTTSLTYGLGADGEVNVTVPLLVTTLDLAARLRQVGTGVVQRGDTDDDAVGVGDVLVRGKYRLLRGRLGELAAGLVFRLPSGNRGDFQGTGFFEVGPRVYASTPTVTLTPHLRARAHLNAGLDLVPEASRRGEGRYGVGVDLLVGARGTLSLAFLAREPFARLLPAGSTDVPRPDGSRSPVFGIDPGHPSYYDLSIGGRVTLWGDTVFGIVNVVVPLNEQGVRSDVIPLVGIEAAF